MKNIDILIVDDDCDLAMITCDLLEDHGYQVIHTCSIEESYVVLDQNQVKLIILDINLPDGVGFEFCKELRVHSTVPIIFISARTSETDRIKGLDIGGDDYLPKPYSLQELLSRINATMRRTYGFDTGAKKITFGEVIVDEATRTVTRGGIVVPLALKEYDLLRYLIDHKNIILKKETILADVWGIFNMVEVSTVAVHIRWLREKLEENPSKPVFIQTVWGVGYRFEVGE
ncbi:two-component system, OmpR family, response regulator VicR [Anaerosporobacter mobilis DSM 15930]|jgi:DNA-binding response OmpR family regulator|uniref:Stage 0 sporulation protein A homolog n=1 Tax=Anaerosporobacter mobilis DSM 15930 TaxID=1120996 RepID=A0A1M7F4A3_9FIRM|nr:response regulator transcription factor [Anaerosporobacter mobilis]SHL98891.1 two-component system, OmpR family, response regulator VicR [Anaerosporobacter mobilis DSM 15930]